MRIWRGGNNDDASSTEKQPSYLAALVGIFKMKHSHDAVGFGRSNFRDRPPTSTLSFVWKSDANGRENVNEDSLPF